MMDAIAYKDRLLDNVVDVLRQQFGIREVRPAGWGVDVTCYRCAITLRVRDDEMAAFWCGVHVVKRHAAEEHDTLDWI